jgi:hypothetical protein
VKVLEAMQLMLNIPGAPIIAFLAIDSRIVVSSIEESFGEVFRSAYISRWEYLDKIVRLPFSVPPLTPDKLKQLASSCLESGASSPAVVANHIRKLYETLIREDARMPVDVRYSYGA